MRTATLAIEGKRVHVKTPYHPLWVIDFKAAIPSTHRMWDADDKEWVVALECLDQVKDLCEEMGWRVVILNGSKKTASTPMPTIHQAYRTLGVLPDADPDVIRKAYTVLSMKHHPDRGGDNSRMREINLAFEYIRKERGL